MQLHETGTCYVLTGTVYRPVSVRCSSSGRLKIAESARIRLENREYTDCVLFYFAE